MNANTDISAIDEFNATFSRYLVWTSKEQGAAVEDRGRKVRFALYRQFKKLAPSAAKIKAQTSAILANGGDIVRRVDPKTDMFLSREDEVKARLKSRMFLSVSFLMKAWKASRDGQNARFVARDRAQTRIGSAIVTTAKGEENPRVSITSFLEGAMEQNSRRNVVNAALREQSADMSAYIKRKHEEMLKTLFSRPFEAVIHA